MSDLYVVIGGVENSDYEHLLHEDKYGDLSKEVWDWAAAKGTKVGDKVIAYIAAPYSAYVAVGEFIGPAYKTDPRKSKYRYRAPCKLCLLPKHLTRKAVQQKFPKWGWAHRTQGKVKVPANIAPKLLALVGSRP